MVQKPLKVIVTRKLPESVETRLCELFDTTLYTQDTPMSRAELAQAVKTAEVLVPTVTDTIDSTLISQAGDQLKMIAAFSNGTDQIDVEAASKLGIVVTNTPNVLTEDTADMTMGLMIALSRRITEGTRAIENGLWEGWSPTWMLGQRIWGKKLGIVGMGRIGTAFAKRAKAFGLSIHYHNRNQVDDATVAELDATYWDSLDQMLARMDIVSVNCPHTPATFHLMSKRRLALMKPDALLINTARGEVIDEEALITALTNNKLGGAGLDFLSYDAAVNPELMKLSNEGKLVILPHMGSATIEGR
ncbi:MAG: 2-hydroxyacid dehydrogenase, partial [Nitratireductor sp.]